MTPQLYAVEYAGFLLGTYGWNPEHPIRIDYGSTANHPQFFHIDFPPEGYGFKKSFRNPNELYFQFLQYLVENLDEMNDDIHSSFPVHSSILNDFINRSKLYNIPIDAIKDFIKTRNLLGQTQIPYPCDLLFVPTIPMCVNMVPWVVETEDIITLFYPFVLNGQTANLKIKELRFYNLIKSLLESKECIGILTHMESTYQSISKLFNSDIITQKLHSCPMGIYLPSLVGKKSYYDNSTINMLFTNSWHQMSDNFYLRGGHDVLEAFLYLSNQYENLHLYLRSSLPNNLDNKFYNLIQNHPNIHIIEFLSEEEMHKLMLSTDIFLIPSARIHVISMLRAMSYAIPVIASDGWGFSEYIDHLQNGILLPGRLNVCTWVDSQDGMLREDYSKIRLGISSSIVSALIANISNLIENPDLQARIGRKARLDAEHRFNFHSWNKSLKKIFDNFFHDESSISSYRLRRAELELEAVSLRLNVIESNLAEAGLL